MLQFTLDLARFTLVTSLIALAGVGVTACVRTPFDATTRLLMGPAFGQALWAIALGSGVAMGLPVSAFAHWLWGGTLLLAVAGGWQLRTSARAPEGGEVSQRSPLIHACVWLLPVLVMGPYFWHRLAEYPGSGLPDGWAYAAYGQYLWDFANGTEGGLAPLYQYASTLSSTRTIASAQLGVLALLNQPGDAQAGFGLLQAAGLAAYGSAVTMAFLLTALHTAPLPREFLGFRAERANFFAIAPDRQWLGFVQYVTEHVCNSWPKRPFDGPQIKLGDATDPNRIQNDTWPSFPIRYATRRDRSAATLAPKPAQAAQPQKSTGAPAF